MDRTTALLIVDMQMEMANATAAGRPRANPQAEALTAELLSGFRAAGLPVVHVMHDDPRPTHRFRKDRPGGQAMPCAMPQDGEPVFWKAGSSGFSGTGLAEHLRAAGITRLVITGGVAAFCVASTVRAASDPGCEVLVPEDALIGFAMPSRHGGDLDAEAVLEVTLAGLQAGFATVLTTAQILEKLPAGLAAGTAGATV